MTYTAPRFYLLCESHPEVLASYATQAEAERAVFYRNEIERTGRVFAYCRGRRVAREFVHGGDCPLCLDVLAGGGPHPWKKRGRA